MSETLNQGKVFFLNFCFSRTTKKKKIQFLLFQHLNTVFDEFNFLGSALK